MRFALGVDEDMAAFHRRFRRDPLVGPLIRRMPDFRPRRRPWPWEALAAAVCGQLIEASRAAVIERRIVGRWGARLGEGRGALRDVPPAALIAGRAPAELQSMDLSGGRSVALRRLAREVARGRCDVGSPGRRRRLLAIPEIGPWTVQCLALFGRGEMDSLPAGDLGYIKLVGHLAGLGRRATIPEVEEFYAPYEPYRGLVGCLTLAGLYRLVARARRSRARAPDRRSIGLFWYAPALRLIDGGPCLRGLSSSSSKRAASVDKTSMPESGDTNWPDDEVG